MRWSRWVAVGSIILLFTSCSGDRGDILPRYALVYGVSSYDSSPGSIDLSYADDDAQDLADLFTGAGFTGVVARADSAVTRNQIETDFENMAATIPEEAVFVFHFSGHGFGSGKDTEYGEDFLQQVPEGTTEGTSSGDDGGSDSRDEWIFPYGSLSLDGETGDTIVDWARAISDDDLATLVRSIPARHRVVIIDACHSGGFIGDIPLVDRADASIPDLDGEWSRIEAVGRYFSSLREYDLGIDDALVLAASGEREFSLEGSTIENGFFTYFILEGASGPADTNGDGWIGALELYSFAALRIASRVNTSTGISSSDRYASRANSGAVDVILLEAP